MKQLISCFLAFCLLVTASPCPAEKPAGISLPASTITDMHLEGYVNEKVDGLIQKWALTALDNNPNLIGAVALASTGKGIEESPYEGLIADQCEYLGKHLTGLAELYRIAPSKALKGAGDSLVQQLDEARGKDGYLGVRRRTARLSAGTWDLWGHYHMICGLLAWYQATRNTLSRQIAMDAGDYCLRHFAKAPTYGIGSAFANYAICHAYTMLYQETGAEKYLQEAERIVRQDWLKHGNWLNNARAGKDFYQSDEPRWETLHAIQALGGLFEITENKDYIDAFEQIWWSILKTDRHNSGAFATYEKAVGSPYGNDGLETCACVAWAVFTTDYLRYSRKAYVADELELTYYNALLGALMDNHRQVTYSTPMNGYRISCQESLNWAFNSGVPDFNCCQANACRAIGSLSKWAAMTGDNSIYVNYYGPCAIDCLTPGGQQITLRIEGNYPISGDIGIIVEGLSVPEEFTLQLRIPSWARGSSVTFDGMISSKLDTGVYYPLTTVWENGDAVDVHLCMTVHYWKGESLWGTKASMYWGPILLALDENHINPDVHFIHAVMLLMSSVENAQAENGADTGCMLHFRLADRDGNEVTLVDFASAGQNRVAYASWLNIIGALSPLPFEREGIPVWQNGLQ